MSFAPPVYIIFAPRYYPRSSCSGGGRQGLGGRGLEDDALAFLRPFGAFGVEGISPRVPLRSTLGYDPAPLRGSRGRLR